MNISGKSGVQALPLPAVNRVTCCEAAILAVIGPLPCPGYVHARGCAPCLMKLSGPVFAG